MAISRSGLRDRNDDENDECDFEDCDGTIRWVNVTNCAQQEQLHAPLLSNADCAPNVPAMVASGGNLGTVTAARAPSPTRTCSETHTAACAATCYHKRCSAMTESSDASDTHVCNATSMSSTKPYAKYASLANLPQRQPLNRQRHTPLSFSSAQSQTITTRYCSGSKSDRLVKSVRHPSRPLSTIHFDVGSSSSSIESSTSKFLPSTCIELEWQSKSDYFDKSRSYCQLDRCPFGTGGLVGTWKSDASNIYSDNDDDDVEEGEIVLHQDEKSSTSLIHPASIGMNSHQPQSNHLYRSSRGISRVTNDHNYNTKGKGTGREVNSITGTYRGAQDQRSRSKSPPKIHWQKQQRQHKQEQQDSTFHHQLGLHLDHNTTLYSDTIDNSFLHINNDPCNDRERNCRISKTYYSCTSTVPSQNSNHFNSSRRSRNDSSFNNYNVSYRNSTYTDNRYCATLQCNHNSRSTQNYLHPKQQQYQQKLSSRTTELPKIHQELDPTRKYTSRDCHNHLTHDDNQVIPNSLISSPSSRCLDPQHPRQMYSNNNRHQSHCTSRVVADMDYDHVKAVSLEKKIDRCQTFLEQPQQPKQHINMSFTSPKDDWNTSSPQSIPLYNAPNALPTAKMLANLKTNVAKIRNVVESDSTTDIERAHNSISTITNSTIQSTAVELPAGCDDDHDNLAVVTSPYVSECGDIKTDDTPNESPLLVDGSFVVLGGADSFGRNCYSSGRITTSSTTITNTTATILSHRNIKYQHIDDESDEEEGEIRQYPLSCPDDFRQYQVYCSVGNGNYAEDHKPNFNTGNNCSLRKAHDNETTDIEASSSMVLQKLEMEKSGNEYLQNQLPITSYVFALVDNDDYHINNMHRNHDVIESNFDSRNDNGNKNQFNVNLSIATTVTAESSIPLQNRTNLANKGPLPTIQELPQLSTKLSNNGEERYTLHQSTNSCSNFSINMAPTSSRNHPIISNVGVDTIPSNMTLMRILKTTDKEEEEKEHKDLSYNMNRSSVTSNEEEISIQDKCHVLTPILTTDVDADIQTSSLGNTFKDEIGFVQDKSTKINHIFIPETQHSHMKGSIPKKKRKVIFNENFDKPNYMMETKSKISSNTPSISPSMRTSTVDIENSTNAIKKSIIKDRESFDSNGSFSMQRCIPKKRKFTSNDENCKPTPLIIAANTNSLVIKHGVKNVEGQKLNFQNLKCSHGLPIAEKGNDESKTVDDRDVNDTLDQKCTNESCQHARIYKNIDNNNVNDSHYKKSCLSSVTQELKKSVSRVDVVSTAGTGKMENITKSPSLPNKMEKDYKIKRKQMLNSSQHLSSNKKQFAHDRDTSPNATSSSSLPLASNHIVSPKSSSSKTRSSTLQSNSPDFTSSLDKRLPSDGSASPDLSPQLLVSRTSKRNLFQRDERSDTMSVSDILDCCPLRAQGKKKSDVVVVCQDSNDEGDIVHTPTINQKRKEGLNFRRRSVLSDSSDEDRDVDDNLRCIYPLANNQRSRTDLYDIRRSKIGDLKSSCRQKSVNHDYFNDVTKQNVNKTESRDGVEHRDVHTVLGKACHDNIDLSEKRIGLSSDNEQDNFAIQTKKSTKNERSLSNRSTNSLWHLSASKIGDSPHNSLVLDSTDKLSTSFSVQNSAAVVSVEDNLIRTHTSCIKRENGSPITSQRRSPVSLFGNKTTSGFDNSNDWKNKDDVPDCSDPTLVTVGCRVSIYWDGEDDYFAGTVTKEKCGKRRPFRVKYDDGDKEWVNFHHERFTLLSLPSGNKHSAFKSDMISNICTPSSCQEKNNDLENKAVQCVSKQAIEHIQKKSVHRTNDVQNREKYSHFCKSSSETNKSRVSDSCTTALNNPIRVTGKEKQLIYRDIPVSALKQNLVSTDEGKDFDNNWVSAGLRNDSSDSDTDDDEIMHWGTTMFGLCPNTSNHSIPSQDIPTKSTLRCRGKKRLRVQDSSNNLTKTSVDNYFDSVYRSPCVISEQVERRKREEARPLTAEEIQNILKDDANDVNDVATHWVRRSSRQPSKSALAAPKIQSLLAKLKNNDPDMVVLKMKKYCSDPATPQLVINTVLEALEDNTNCEALYIQNFNLGMQDDQVLHLLRILQRPSCKIWCLNIGETYNVQTETWEIFATGLRDTKITHMYASEHTISSELKEEIRDTIRKNRSKHTMHVDPNNLSTIVRCTHCWWNPINAAVLRPYVKRHGYDRLIMDAEAQGLPGTKSEAIYLK